MQVKVELQADCYAGVRVHYKVLEDGDIEEALNAASAIGDDTLRKSTKSHGHQVRLRTARQSSVWRGLKRGLKAGSQARARLRSKFDFLALLAAFGEREISTRPHLDKFKCGFSDVVWRNKI